MNMEVFGNLPWKISTWKTGKEWEDGIERRAGSVYVQWQIVILIVLKVEILKCLIVIYSATGIRYAGSQKTDYC